MSGAPKNIQRDGIFADPDSAKFTFSTVNAANVGNILLNGPTAVNMDFASIACDVTDAITVTGSEKCAMGLYINGPIGDRTPYRVKATLKAGGTAPEVSNALLAIGFAPSSITGSDDIIVLPVYIPFKEEFDDIIIVESQISGDTFFGRALAIAVVLQPSSTITTKSIYATLSVQNLGVKPPTMQNAIS